MATESNNVGTATGAEWALTRIINAPRARVFKAWTDASQLEQWWGPRIASNRCQIDLKPGGAYRIVMVMPDGGEYPLKGVYREIVEPEKLVMTGDVSSHPKHWHSLVNEQRPHASGNLKEFLWTVDFEEQGGKTKLTILTEYESAEDRDALLKLGMAIGWGESLDKLQELVTAHE